MTLRQDMLRAARAAPPLLPGGAAATAEFVLSRLEDDGGFRGRAPGGGDLYYTVFALDCLDALQADAPRRKVATFLRGFGAGEALDFVHLACLARCWAALAGGPPSGLRSKMLEGLHRFRGRDGGYHPSVGAGAASAYGCFLALGAHQDLGEPLGGAPAMARSLEALAVAGGGFANDASVPLAATPATAAAAVALRQLGRPVDRATARWLLDRRCAGGGFAAVPGGSEADLLSTATALHALAALGADFSSLKAPCRSFVLGLQDRGGFRGQPFDDDADVEYTFYGLLALGHLGR